MPNEFRAAIDNILGNYAATEETRKAAAADEASRRLDAIMRFNAFKEGIVLPIMTEAKAALEAAGHHAQITSDTDLNYPPELKWHDFFIELKILKKGQVANGSIVLPHAKYSLENNAARFKIFASTKRISGGSDAEIGAIANETSETVSRHIEKLISDVFAG
jgi:hypothetical protein